MTLLDRRRFLRRTAAALGGLALLPAQRWAAAAAGLPARSDVIHRSARAMGMPARISVPTGSFESSAVEAAFEALRRIDRTLTVFDPSSRLMQLNSQPGQWIGESPELLDVSRAAVHFGNMTEGALDVTVLPVMRRFGYVPGQRMSVERFDYRKLQIHKGAVRLAESGYGVDLGGIAKGYAVDQAILALKAGGIRSAVVDSGGDLFAMGRPSADRLWRAGIRHPDRADAFMALLELEDEAVATSGIGPQSRMLDGHRISHLIDPKTGKSVHHIVSATIVAPDAMTADALATATSVLPLGASRALVDDLPGVEGFWILADGSHSWTPGLGSRIQLI